MFRLPTAKLRQALRPIDLSPRRVNTILGIVLVILCVFALSLEPSQGVDDQGSVSLADRINTLAQGTDIAFNVFSIIAVSAAGVWAYYQFVGARTFYPRMSLDVEHVRPVYSQRLQLFRLVIQNTGKVKITPKRIRIEAFTGSLKDGAVDFLALCERGDVLERNYENFDSARAVLEPDTGMHIDVPLWTPSDHAFCDGQLLLMLRVTATSVTEEFWQRTKMFVLDHE